MVLDLLLIALAITLDPLPVMAFVLVVASARGVWKGLTFILGWLACFVAVIALVLALTGGQPPAPKSPPSTAALAIKLTIGVALVLYGAHRHRRRQLVRDRTPSAATTATSEAGHPDTSEPDVSSRRGSSSSIGSRLDRGSVGASAGLAVLLQPWGLVAAGAVTVVEANTSHFSTWLALFSFCLLATATLLAAELYVVFAPESAQPRLLRMRAWMEGHQQQAIVAGCLLIGLYLTGKSIYQLTS
ncbi:GAP family protein [Streptomyces luteolifulvus]|uniref:GAP family protein n=2 Tax=Streptomyces luteolifulvus TaxID=2615112 RepID=A0A6H9USR4_9ACTN|nr:GAP family protein [Streptomyces luteolifulvus]KAB1141055.1 GAP family protein [Streptomyces luteolifulvus]